MTGDPNEIVTQLELKAEWEAVLGTTSDISADNECIKGQDVSGHSSDGVYVSFDDPTDPKWYSELVRRANIDVHKLAHDTTFCVQYNGGDYHMTPRVSAITILPEFGTTIYPELTIYDEDFKSTYMTVNSTDEVIMLNINLQQVHWDNPLGAPTTIRVEACNAGYGWQDSAHPCALIATISYPETTTSITFTPVPLFKGVDNTILVRILTE